MKAKVIFLGWLWLQAGCGLTDRSMTPAAECNRNLRQIDLAKQLWMLDENRTTNDVPVLADVVGEDDKKVLKRMPKCPSAGIYTLGSMKEKPKCSIPGHGI